MADLITAMSLVIGSWALFALALLGLGLLIRRATGRAPLDTDDLFLSFWLGAAAATLILQLWHLGLPVDARATILLALLGATGLALHAHDLSTLARRAARSPKLLALAALVVLWLSNRAIGPCDHVDSGLYQLHAVRWASEFPIVPGLTNLSNNLGFNNSSALLAATLDVGFWTGRASHLFNSAFLLAILLSALVGAARALRAPSTHDLALGLFSASFATLAVDLASSPHATSFTTDLGPLLMLMVAGLRLFASLLDPAPNPAHARFSLFAITLLVTCAVTWKLSAAGLALAFWLLAAFNWWSAPHPRRLLTLALAALASSLLIAPWLARGIILSGYPLFPSPALPFDVDWRVPLDHTRATHAWVVQYAREATIRPDALASGFDWVARWFRSLPAAGPAKSIFPLLFALAALALRLFQPRSRPLIPGRSNLFFLALTLAAAFWFFTAPAPRFGAHILWLFAGGLLACVVIANPAPPTARGRLVLLLCVLAWIIPTIGIRTVVVFRAQGAIAAGRTLVIGPGPDHGLHPTPTQEHTLRSTTSGDEVWVPIDSDMSWDGPLPMTPFFSTNLEWREPGDPSAGFRAGPGPWQPEIWPHYGSNFLSLYRQKLGLEPVGPAQTTPPGTTRLVAPRRPVPQK